MSLIELKDVSKLYGFGDATNIALDEVNLTIEPGECIAVMGPSGSGKSTLMNIIGLLDRPTHGDYHLNGKKVSRLRPNQRAKYRRDRIGFIFQSFNLLPRLTAVENVALPLLYKGTGSGRRMKKAWDMLERVGLGDRAFYYPRQLSGGQTQSVAIARALVNDPQLIIADEPTGNLDSASSRLVMELLGEIHKTGNTVIFVTHNPELTRYATRVVYMQDGAIKYDEQTKLGEVGRYARSVMYAIPEATEEDDLLGVSALMGVISKRDKAAKPSKAKKKPAKKRAARTTRVKKEKEAGS
ncbi:MAG TPA: ABC transporter ATP-binding protein [Candidatus Saccharimonadales bacterium]|nr:ABC transporter ATP-binding protein [Candidatus Saccharimonadales bacterium]